MKKILLFALLAAGCGGGQTPAPTTPAAQDASVTGQYNLVLTSTNGRGKTIFYTNFTQTGKTFTGAANTLVCPSNDLSQCEGGNPSVISITPSIKNKRTEDSGKMEEKEKLKIKNESIKD